MKDPVPFIENTLVVPKDPETLSDYSISSEKDIHGLVPATVSDARSFSVTNKTKDFSKTGSKRKRSLSGSDLERNIREHTPDSTEADASRRKYSLVANGLDSTNRMYELGDSVVSTKSDACKPKRRLSAGDLEQDIRKFTSDSPAANPVTDASKLKRSLSANNLNRNSRRYTPDRSVESTKTDADPQIPTPFASNLELQAASSSKTPENKHRRLLQRLLGSETLSADECKAGINELGSQSIFGRLFRW